MASIQDIKQTFHDEILVAMARGLWVNAYIDWATKNGACQWCGDTIYRSDEGSAWQDQDGAAVCPDRDGDEPHEPDDEVIATPGEDWNKVAPATPEGAFLAATDLTKLLMIGEDIKGNAPLADLFEMAMVIDQGGKGQEYEYGFHFDAGETMGQKGRMQKLLDEFGWGLANMAVGSGSSWFDNHKEKSGNAQLVLNIPSFEISYDGEDLAWDGKERKGEKPKQRAGKQQARFEGRGQRTTRAKIGNITIVNPNDEDAWGHSYVVAWNSSLYLIYASSLGDAIDELVDWANENAPGFIANEYAAELETEAREEGMDDERIDEFIEGHGLARGGNAGDWYNAQEIAIVATDPSTAEVARLAMRDNPPGNAMPPGIGANDPAQRTRGMLAQRSISDRCSDTCQGWDIFDTDRGFEIESCDECNANARRADLPAVTDADVSLLPEARRALREAQEAGEGGLVDELAENPPGRYFEVTWPGGKATYPASYLGRAIELLTKQGVLRSRITTKAVRGNPAGLTRKGHRMYKAIEKGYRAVGEARAKEVASRTVLSRARQGARGLVKAQPAKRRRRRS